MPKKKLINISTKGGDSGTSGLVDGVRLPKSSQIFVVLGDLDELNTWIGYSLVTLSQKLPEQSAALRHAQKNLYLMSALIAKADPNKVTLANEELTILEKNSLFLQKSMSHNWTQAFLYPGGTETAARLDIARTVCRRAERALVELSQQQHIPEIALKYVNRLSDYLYVLRCFVNFKEGYQEALFDTE
ncbi:MAG: cob(I)yrinic acid a,c-diamide adenosyltransferase [Pseudomonadales bacterium]|nr:cob(I)yrinic acid a,c-diamide adenosyltransferase [Pseudomonadales bacterium]